MHKIIIKVDNLKDKTKSKKGYEIKTSVKNSDSTVLIVEKELKKETTKNDDARKI